MKLELLYCPLPYLSLHTVEPSLEDFEMSVSAGFDVALGEL